MKRLRGYERGQVLALAAISMVVLMGFLALAVDVGMLWTERRQMQTAADAAAVAAAVALRDGDDVQTAGQGAASLNSFTNGQNSVTVTVNNPPLSGSYAGNSSYVEAIVNEPESTYFLRALGYTSVSVTTRAVGGTVNGPACMYALDSTKSAAIGVTGNFSINASCGVIDDSSSSSAFTATGNGTFDATSFGIVGGTADSGNISINPTPITKIAPAADPLASTAEPIVSSCTQASTNKSGQYSITGNNPVVDVAAGVYPSGISITGNNPTVTFSGGTYGNNIVVDGNSGNVTFNPGQYQNTGTSDSIDIEGNAGTTFASGSYTFCGRVSITGNNVVTLSPGLYSGGISITGNANVTFLPGTYILAGGGLTVTGNSTLSGTGVTFYDTTGPAGYKPIDLTGNETANLSAPTSGATEGMLFFQDRSISSGSGSSIIGNSSSTFDGVLYFPTTSLTYDGNSSSSGYTYFIADTITFTGNTDMTIGNNTSSLADGAPIKSSALYE
jgi:Flp pilus assembly protein TadG